MKKTRARSKSAATIIPTETTDLVVEDLLQQDVLPVNDVAVSDDASLLADPMTQTDPWEQPVGDLGHRGAHAPLEDEGSLSEKLVNDGIAEADEELRELDEVDHPDE